MIKKIIEILTGKRNKTIRRTFHTASAACPSCHGSGSIYLGATNGTKRVTCPTCMASVVIGDYKLEVSGTDSNEVEAVLKKLIDEITNKITQKNKTAKIEKTDYLEDLSESLKVGEISNSIISLIDFCEINKMKEYKNEGIGLLSRYNNLRRLKRKGTISYDEFIINQNKIIYSITEILSLINGKIGLKN